MIAETLFALLTTSMLWISSCTYSRLCMRKKVHDELLINENQTTLPHPEIRFARGAFLNQPKTGAAKAMLEGAIEPQDAQEVRARFLAAADGYTGGDPAA